MCRRLEKVVTKSYQREGQPRKTENEFSHDHLTTIHRESDDHGLGVWLGLGLGLGLGKSVYPCYGVIHVPR